MKSPLLLVIVLFTSFSIQAQVPKWQWAKGDTTAKINGTATHVVAATHNTVLWGQALKRTGPSSATGGYKVSEFDSAGNYLTSVNITGNFTLIDAHPDDAGNWYLLGQYTDTINFPGGLQYIRNPFAFPSGPEYFMLRLNSGSLSMAWTQHIGTNNYSTASAFTIANGKIYIVIDSVTTFINTLDLATGNRTVLWSQTGLSRVSSIAVDNAGNIYVAGNCSNNIISFNGHVDSFANFYNNYIVRYKANGNFDWVIWMGDLTCTPRELSLVSNNFIYYSGPLNDSLTIGSFHLHKPFTIGNGFMAARIDSSGDVSWARQDNDSASATANMDNVYDAVVTNDSCLNLCLKVRGSMNFGNGVSTTALSTQTLATLVCIKPDSTTKWLKQIGCQQMSSNHLASNGKDVYITGNGYDNTAISFDSLVIPVTLLNAHVPFVAKLNAIATHPGSYVAPLNEINLTIAPNPATSTVNILGMEKAGKAVLVTLTDVYGKVVFSKKYAAPNGREEIQVGSYPRGLYFVAVSTDEFKTVQKIVLQ